MKANDEPDKTFYFCQRCGRKIKKKDIKIMNGLQVGYCCWKPQSFREKVIYK
jgi:DNA-directed RNA polymerase subunit RPC12/RpoP